MLSTRHLSFSAANRATPAPQVLRPLEEESAVDQFMNVLQELLGKSAKNIGTSDTEIDTKPADLPLPHYEDNEEIRNDEGNDISELPLRGQDEKEQKDRRENNQEQDITVTCANPQAIQKHESLQEYEDGEGSEPQVTPNQNFKENPLLQVGGAAEEAAKEAVAKVAQQVSGNKVETPVGREFSSPTGASPELTAVTNAAIGKVAPSHTESTPESTEAEFNPLLPGTPELQEVSSKPFRPEPQMPVAPSVKNTPVAQGLSHQFPPKSDLRIELLKSSFLEKGIQGITAKDLVSGSALPGAALLGEKVRIQHVKEGAKTVQLSQRQEQIINQINKLIDQAAKLKDGSSLTIKVTPEELGQVLVKVTQRADQLFARVVPESKEVEEAVRAGVTQIVSQLVAAGFKAENIHVSVGKETPEFESQQQQSFLFEQNSEQSTGRHGSRLENGKAGIEAAKRDSVAPGRKAVDSGWVA